MARPHHIIASLSLLFAGFATVAPAAADVLYLWTPQAGSGGAGFIRFSDTLADPANFEVQFNTTNAPEFSFTFDNGATSGGSVGFDNLATLQNHGALNNTNKVFAEDGVLDMTWTITYTNVIQFVPQDEFDDASSVLAVCISDPCPIVSADVDFIGPRASEINIGTFTMAPVPLPGAVLGFLPAAALLLARKRRSSV